MPSAERHDAENEPIPGCRRQVICGSLFSTRQIRPTGQFTPRTVLKPLKTGGRSFRKRDGVAEVISVINARQVVNTIGRS